MHSQDTIPLQADKHHVEPTEEQPAKEHELKAAEEPQQKPVENQFEQPCLVGRVTSIESRPVAGP